MTTKPEATQRGGGNSGRASPAQGRPSPSFRCTQATGTGSVNDYWANDLVASQTVGDNRESWTIDPAHRFDTSTTGEVELQLADLHGDIVITLDTALSSLLVPPGGRPRCRCRASHKRQKRESHT